MENKDKAPLGLLLRMRPALRRVLPEGLRCRVRERIYAAANALARRRTPPPTALRPGLKLYGMIDAATGMGSASRLLAGGCRAAGIPFSLGRLTSESAARVKTDWDALVTAENSMNTNLFVANADCTAAFLYQVGAGVLNGRYNIAHWSWELPEWPDVWQGSFRPYQEIWTISEFCRAAIAAKSPVPVYVIPYGITVAPDESLCRAHFGLPEGKKLFLCMYDVHSIASRKNPQGAIDAYCRAFPEEGNTALVVKVSGAEHAAQELEALRQRLSGRGDVYLLEGSYPKGKIDALIALCDVFISLHRSEGFGLPIAEAMALGKNVVVTGWSGNMDFTNADNACCVKYTLQKVGALAEPPYDAWQTWAEPDAEDAAAYLRRLVQEEDYARRLAAAGKRTIEERFSPQRCGEAMAARLRALGQLE